jgi:glycosyltransferase involved in cell wall biosynthesis
MRLVLATATPATVPSGSGTYLATGQLAKELEARGHVVRFVRPSKNPDRWPGLALHRHLFNLGLTASEAEGDTDLVVGFDMDGWKIAGRTRVPFVAYLLGVIADEASFERGAPRWSLETQAWAEQRSAQRATLVLTTSQYSRRRIMELYGTSPDRIRMVQPGIDVDRWLTALARSQARGHPDPTVLVVAHSYPRKNVAALLRAAASLQEDLPRLRIRIVGDGPERSRLETLTDRLGLRPAVTFLGHVPFTTLADEYAACTVFCLPSLQEGFGLVFVEAMAAGKAIVALAAGAVPELVVDGVNGLLAPPHDDAALATALRRALTDSPLRARMAETNRTRAKQFSASRMADHFLEAVMPLVSTQHHS